MFKELLKIVLILQVAVTMAWSCQVFKNISPTDPELHKSRVKQGTTTAEVGTSEQSLMIARTTFFLFSWEEGKLHMGMEKVLEGQNGLSFSTNFQTNAAVSESQWNKLFDLWYKKLLLIGCVYIRLDCADPIP